MRRTAAGCTALFFVAATLSAEVSIIERRSVEQNFAAKEKPEHARRLSALAGAGAGAGGLHYVTEATGEQQLTDTSGLEYFINTNITFTTSSSASGAASEASITATVAATTSAGGTTTTTLTDAFDGYNGLFLSTTGATGPCATDDPDCVSYNENGPGTTECGGRQIVLNPQLVGGFSVRRKVFVPTDDAYARWMNVVTNTGGAAASINLITANNLGSDDETLIVESSDGDSLAELTDTWVSTFQDFSGGGFSPDPRLGHVLRGEGAPVGLAAINFANGDDNPFWAYSLTLAPGETAIVLNFVTGQRSRQAAAAKAAELALLPPNAVQCMSATEQAQIVNFVPGGLAAIGIPTASETGLLALALLLATVGALALRHRMARHMD